MSDLGARLSQRREEMMASPAQVAEWSGLPEERVSQIEAGDSMAAWEFEELSRALAVDSGILTRGEARSPRRSLARFRTAAGQTVLEASDLRLLALGAEAGRIGGFLARELSVPIRLADTRRPQPVQENEPPWKQGYRLGEAARGRLVPRSGPIPDLERVLEELGIHVARVTFQDDELEAASFWETGAMPVVLIHRTSSAAQSSLSRRALLAHELCHLLHDSGEQDLTTQLTWGEGAAGWNEDVEQRARAFAPAFLAPRDEVRHWFRAGEGRSIRDPAAKVKALAKRWGFSLDGAVWHAKNCRIIGASDARHLVVELSRDRHDWEQDFESGRPADECWNPHRLGDVEVVSPIFAGQIGRLTEQAAASGIISEGRAREILSWH